MVETRVETRIPAINSMICVGAKMDYSQQIPSDVRRLKGYESDIITSQQDILVRSHLSRYGNGCIRSELPLRKAPL